MEINKNNNDININKGQNSAVFPPRPPQSRPPQFSPKTPIPPHLNNDYQKNNNQSKPSIQPQKPVIQSQVQPQKPVVQSEVKPQTPVVQPQDNKQIDNEIKNEQTKTQEKVLTPNLEVVSKKAQKVKVKKEKKQKVKKEKIPLTKKQKKKIFYITLISLILAVALAWTIVFLVIINTKLQTPTDLCVYKVGNNSYIELGENKEAEFYELVIQKVGEDDSVVLSLTSNSYNSTAYFSQTGTFKIKARYIGKTEKANSDYCEEITYINTLKLGTPQITYNAETDTYSWVKIENADGYKIYFNSTKVIEIDDSGTDANFTFTPTAEQKTLIGTGHFDVSVVATSTNTTNYKISDLSNKISVVYGTQIATPSDVNFDEDLQKLSFNFSQADVEIIVAITHGVGVLAEIDEYIFITTDSVSQTADIAPYSLEDITKIEIYAKGDTITTFDSETTTWQKP